MVELLNEFLWRSGDWAETHVHDIALALIATLLGVYGTSAARLLARPLRPYPRPLRVGAFVLLCTLGFGAATVWATPLLAEALLYIETRYLGVAAIGAFLVLGYLAERRIRP